MKLPRTERFWRSGRGSMVLEAALALPLFLTYMLAMIAMIQVSVAEMAVQSAVSETVKLVSAHMYPVNLLADEAKMRWEMSRAGTVYGEVLDKVNGARGLVASAEDFVTDYASFVPDPLIRLIELEKEKREHLETMTAEQYAEYKEKLLTPLIRQSLTAVVRQQLNEGVIHPASLHVTNAVLPDLESGGNAYFGLEAEVELTLAIPFIRKTVLVKKQAYERVWVGA
jgi:hypothetical protein